MKVAVIIPSLYEVDGAYLKLCVESIRATTDWQIVVVTNGSTVKPDLSHIRGISVHLHTRDQGQCNAVNIGAQVVEPNVDYIMVSNSDMYYPEYWNSYLRFDHLVFSPNLVEPTNNLGSAPPFLKFDGGFTLEEFNKVAVDHFFNRQHMDFRYIESKEIRVEPGFNLPFFIRKDVFDTIGGYDTAYDPWGSNSDTDLQTAVNLAGITPMRLRDVWVYHFSMKSGTFGPDKQAFYQNNWEYFHDKWGFDRDELHSDVWYNRDMLPKNLGQIKYKPKWAGKYAA